MNSLFFGIDVSKGYADFCCINQAGSRIGEVVQFDDDSIPHYRWALCRFVGRGPFLIVAVFP